MSADGSVVVGRSSSASGWEAFIWDATNGMRSLSTVLTTDFGVDLSGWTLTFAYGISDDGNVIVGTGTNPSGQTEAWLADLTPTPASILGVVLGGQTGLLTDYTIPTGSNDQLVPLDLDGVKEITLVFDSEAQLGADVAMLSGTNNSDIELFGPLTKPGPDAGTFQATWLLDSPLSPDEYTLMLFDTVADLNGVQLDGEWIDGVSTVSGDGIPGGDFVFRFNIGPAGLPGGPAVPEPGGIVLAGFGLLVVMARRGKKSFAGRAGSGTLGLGLAGRLISGIVRFRTVREPLRHA